MDERESSRHEVVPIRLPMFPLGTVLFPHVGLPLRIFEPRYRALVDDCLRVGQEFGVVLISRGSEVGGGDERFPIGTVAHIVEATELADGQWLLMTVGTRRIEVVTWLPDDPYPVALAQDLPEERLGAGAEELTLLAEAEGAVRKGLLLQAQLGEARVSPTVRLAGDPHVAAYQLASIAPLGTLDQQDLLSEPDPHQRLRRLRVLADDAVEVLAYRLAGG